MTGSWIRFAGQFPTFLKTDSLIHSASFLYSYIFVHGFPGSRLFKMTFPESASLNCQIPCPVQNYNPESRSPFFPKSRIPGFKKVKSRIPKNLLGTLSLVHWASQKKWGYVKTRGEKVCGQKACLLTSSFHVAPSVFFVPFCSPNRLKLLRQLDLENVVFLSAVL